MNTTLVTLVGFIEAHCYGVESYLKSVNPVHGRTMQVLEAYDVLHQLRSSFVTVILTGWSCNVYMYTS